ncbi:MAG: hypothetical protein VW397_09085, partial [Candidatus Margulisiibacteriota bacterium]
PIPNELRAVNGVDEFFDRLYNIQTDLAAFNFRLDDYADELRDLKLVHLFSELFPNMDDVELDIHRKLSDGTNLDSKEAVESYLQQHTTLEQEPYTSNGNDNLKQAIIASLVSAWASYDSAIKSFKVLINEAATQVRGDALYEDEMVSLLAHIILKYKDVFRNFILACEANINPGDNGKLILAAEKVHNNMNMIPFHMMASILSLTLFGKNPDEIAQIIENSGYSKLNVNLQKAARYGNNISSAARELDKGDISGHLEILGYYFKTNQNWKLNPRQRYQKCLIDMKKISSRNQGLAKLRREFFNSDDPDLKADSLSLRWFAHEINNRFEENKSELALVLKKDISGITEENVKKIIELIFPTDSEPAYKLLLFHLIGRGSI